MAFSTLSDKRRFLTHSKELDMAKGSGGGGGASGALRTFAAGEISAKYERGYFA